MSAPTVVGISGSLSTPSRTAALVGGLLDGIATATGARTKLIELADAADALFAVRSPHDINPAAREVLSTVEGANMLVVGTPVYRASYSGVLKHLFDLVDHRAFAGKPVVLAATGGSLMHGLVIEHQLRPLFGFLGALTLPTAVYAVETDFADYRLINSNILARIQRASAEAVPVLKRHKVNVALATPAVGQVGPG